ncbi:cell wall hydrolase [Sphingomonas desiccabilis]|uniref:Cell wall hydrolase n=1 Tax=Sphingomonas desiccabilis TaxID=429134 RepID=A0A4Q2IQ80_9SPHN|nr:cell wall hydrolase [Sphingomonas desiccabilis]MBB3912171.1 spore germination cell wall hydrolase CwlJ-like protein [Sphingomonas desiccabilis]RXZ30332.1 cell wall hydrolase [Sphingomonas desiccabilis]
MSSKKRTACTAALYLCVALLGAITTPGFAFEAERASVETVNVESAAKVPAAPVTQLASVATTAAPAASPLKPQTVTFAASTPIVQAVGTASVTATFGSLAAAVAAQPSNAGEDEQINCLATGIYYEAKGEPLSGQLAVAEVILNRTQSGRFPDTACGVLKQRGQFSFVRGGKLPEPNAGSTAWRTAVAVAHVAKRALWDSPADGALFFHARHLAPRWGKARVASVGNHIFYR